MSTQSQSFPGARQRTFGVELEIVVPWLWEGEPDPNEELASQLPPILRLPLDLKEAYESRIISENDKVLRSVYDLFTDILGTHGIPADIKDIPTISSTDSSFLSDSMAGVSILSLDDYNKWGVKRDDTVSGFGGGYKWYGIEIVSSAERASTESFHLIRYALNVLKSSFRIAANPSCGMHVHVGDGSELMPLDHVRRVAGLFWAADPLLACIHPPHRRVAYYSQSIRERSNLAKGAKASQKDNNELSLGCCDVYIGGRVRHGESPISWREENHRKRHLIGYGETRQRGHFEPFFMKDPNDELKVKNAKILPLSSYRIASDENLGVDIQVEEYATSKNNWDAVPNTPYVSTRNRETPRYAYPVYNPKEIGSTEFSHLEAKAAEDIGIFLGAREIFTCLTSCTIEWLLRAGERPNYNLSPYACYRLENRGSRPGTIEFREAAGTVDGGWAETWARICVGLTHFAIHAPVEDYLSVLYHIHRAASERAPYDVLDLLDDAGLFAEAAIVEKRLLQNKEEWGLKFMPNLEDSDFPDTLFSS
ncbi:uncharacterized protein F4807DRAFT_468791 [Annulohypoxylon truncatum]|uniref:uncharacterized protein n=1 Tax=Annulohypoxylon truncatum TaxID=327061 RepID=UPI0020089664|nr:uncharacterized protein F4807DRAFT_468791 [Annulohypoxylon truncatum]KAI1208206.1 hypothetical protein F4807DRAFT_468791 [Annulohypoxylon truncatum]